MHVVAHDLVVDVVHVVHLTVNDIGVVDAVASANHVPEVSGAATAAASAAATAAATTIAAATAIATTEAAIATTIAATTTNATAATEATSTTVATAKLGVSVGFSFGIAIGVNLGQVHHFALFSFGFEIIVDSGLANLGPVVDNELLNHDANVILLIEVKGRELLGQFGALELEANVGGQHQLLFFFGSARLHIIDHVITGHVIITGHDVGGSLSDIDGLGTKKEEAGE